MAYSTTTSRLGDHLVFVTRKIPLGVDRIASGLQKTIKLGGLSAKRDWGYAPEYVDAARRTLQFEKPEDFLLATGELHSVKEYSKRRAKSPGSRIQTA
jgi:GDPmannose 4,6-dehydratase